MLAYALPTKSRSALVNSTNQIRVAPGGCFLNGQAALAPTPGEELGRSEGLGVLGPTRMSRASPQIHACARDAAMTPGWRKCGAYRLRLSSFANSARNSSSARLPAYSAAPGD